MKKLSIAVLSLAVLLLLPASMASAQSSVSKANMNLSERSVSNADMNLDPGVRASSPQPSGETASPNPFRDPEAVYTFPSALSIVVGSVGFVDAEQVGFFWSVARGDSVTESFVGPSSITRYNLDVDVISNGLNSGAFVNWNVFINGVLVDNFTVNEGFFGTVNRSASFGTIAGPNYTVELRVTNEVAGGQGAHTFRYAGIGFNEVELIPSGARVCLDTFCDVFFCGKDNGNNISCEWDWTCDGSDNEEMIGTLIDKQVTIGGLLEALGLTESAVFDTPSRTVDLWIWSGIGSTSPLASDTWTLNCPIGPREQLPSLHEAIATPDE